MRVVNSQSTIPNHSASTRSTVGSSSDKQGALILIDSFESSTSHGYMVEGAALTLGTPSAVFRHHQRQQIDGRQTMPHVAAFANLQVALGTALISAEDSKTHLEEFLETAVAGNIGLSTSLLDKVTQESFEHSVVNLSQGLDALTLLHMLKTPLGPRSRLSPAEQEIYRSNLESSISTGVTPLSEPQKDNLLLQSIKSVLKASPEIQQATEGWRGGVRAFEEGHNSVVVAAGNSGKTLKALSAAGFDIDGSEDFNLLSIPEVTTVGASTESAQGVSLSLFSSFGPEVDIIASGQYGEQFGTSFSSPKVANVMRAVHQAHPEFSSDQVQEWTTSHLCDHGRIGPQTVNILDTGRVSTFLQA